MQYYFSKTIHNGNMDEVIEKAKAALKEEGFGVLTEIDVKATLKEKIGAEFKPYRILGACNPYFAYQALQKEDKIGVMLPCNVVVEQNEDGTIEVSAVDPVASMQAIENPELEAIATQVRQKLQKVIEAI